MRELYIYYRVADADVAAARRSVEAMHERLHQAHPGLVARLLTRADDGSAPQTWMETYALAGSDEGVGAQLEAEIEAQAARWSDLVAGSRHVEAFAAVLRSG